MSDAPEAADWWQAADDKWYAPEHHPDAIAARHALLPPPPPPEQQQPIYAPPQVPQGPARTTKQSVRNGVLLLVPALLISLGIGWAFDAIVTDASTVDPACRTERQAVEQALASAMAQSGHAYDVRGLVFLKLLSSFPRHHVVSLLGPSGTATKYRVVATSECSEHLLGIAAERAGCRTEQRSLETALAAARTDGPPHTWADYLEQPPEYFTVSEAGYLDLIDQDLADECY